MVLIVKKFVKIYKPSDNVPKKYKNLRKNKHVHTYLKPYPTIPKYLVKEHGLKWQEKIIVFHVKEITKGSWENYRTPFKKVYYGTVKDFENYLRGFLKELNEKRRKKTQQL